MNEPLISIIIPTYNRADIISATLDSILSQTYTNWECIIVDDISDDNTQEIIAAYTDKDNRFQYFQRPHNTIKGANSCRNYGFEMSKGDYIQWFDSDDVYFNFALENYVGALDEKTDAVVAKLDIVNFKSGLKIKENVIFSNTVIEDYFTGKIVYYVCGPLWKRAFLQTQSKLFDESISNLDDWDFNLRMLYEKPIIKYNNKSLIKYRFHENSLSQELVKLNLVEIQSEFAAREKHLLLLSQNKMADLKILKKFISKRYNYFFREAMVQNHPTKFYFLKKLLRSEFFLFDIYGILKTVVGFLIYSVFKKGYVLLK